MPNIRENNAPSGLGLNPTEIGVDAIAGAARRAGSFYAQKADAISSEGQMVGSTIRDVGDAAVKFEDHREISAGAAAGAQQIANLNDQWNTTLKGGKDADGNAIPPADPNDPSTAAKFRDQVLEPALDKFKSGFNTERSQEWAEHFVDQYRQHMFEKTAADMSTMAGIAVKTNYEKTKNLLSSAVASDPSSLDFVLKSVDHSVGAMADSSPNLDATVAAKVKSELSQSAKEAIVKSAVSSLIQKNPNIDLDAIQKKYGEYVNGAEMKMFQKAAQTQAKVDAYHDKSAAIAQRQLDDLNVHKSATDTITKNISVDQTTGKPIINPKFFNDALEIARKNPDAPSAAATVRTMLDWGESQMNKEEKIVTDPAVKQGLTDRLFDPDHPTTQIDLMKAQIAGKLNDHDFQAMDRLVKELAETPLKGPVWQATAAAAKDALIVTVPGIPGKDTVGTANYSTFMQSFIPQYLAKSRDGTLPPNALDVKDPNSMISQAMAPFKRTAAQRMKDYMSVMEGAGGGGPPGAPPAAAAAAAPEGPKRISTKAEYDALPVNTRYISAKDGQTYEKR